jgi:hypothetical protein
MPLLVLRQLRCPLSVAAVTVAVVGSHDWLKVSGIGIDGMDW